jgi:dTDP-glucose 4,6-dehydratase
MKILITGGIGSNFLNLFVPRLAEHHFVNADALTYAGHLGNLTPVADAPNYTFERTDIADLDAVMGLFEKHHPDLVVHFAAETHVDRSITEPRAFLRANVEGTFSLLEACRAHWRPGHGVLHHVSTDEVYGSLGPTGRFTEETRYDPSSPYSASKAASDHLVRAYLRTFDIGVKITHCSNNYGPLQFPEKLIPRMITNLIERKPLPVYGKGENVRDWVYVTDHCEAIWAVIERGKIGETYNIGGHDEQRNIDVVRLLIRVVAEETGADEKAMLDLITYVTDRPGHDLRYAVDTRKIEREVGWTPTETFESGIRKTVRWYLRNTRWCDEVRSGSRRRWIGQSDADRASPIRTPTGVKP